MKREFNFNRQSLIQAIDLGGSLANENKALPILENIKVIFYKGRCYVSSCDGESQITVGFAPNSGADELQETVFYVMPKNEPLQYLKFVKDESVNVTFDDEVNKLTISHTKGNIDFPLQKADEYPEFEKDQKQEKIVFDSKVISEWFSEGVNFTSNDVLRAAFTGLNMQISENKCVVYASDSHALYRNATEIEYSGEEKTCIVSKKVVKQIINLCRVAGKITFELSERNATFTNEYGMKLTTRLVDGRQPNFAAVIPQSNRIVVSVNKKEFIDTLNRCAVAANASLAQVRLSFANNGKLIVDCEDLDNLKRSREEMTYTVKSDGFEPITIGFNKNILMNCLAVVDSEEVVMQMNEPSRAALLNKEGETDKVALCMPVML